MFELVALLIGAVAGFVGSRLLRRPSSPAVASRGGRSPAPVRPAPSPDLHQAALSAVVAAAQAQPGQGALPAAFIVGLNPRDFASIASAPGSFSQRVEQAFEQWAHGHGLGLAGRPNVSMREDPAVAPGRPRAAATSTRAEPPPRPSPPPAARPTAAAENATLVADPEYGRHELRSDPVVVGRSSTATIRIDDGHVSRTHATLRRRDGGWTITDERSSNGTRVNGRSITAGEATPLRDGDQVAIGPATFTYRTAVDDDITRAVDLGPADRRSP